LITVGGRVWGAFKKKKEKRKNTQKGLCKTKENKKKKHHGRAIPVINGHDCWDLAVE
jgi:hypothetical protein